MTVQLEDTSGDVLATTMTDNHGDYRFDNLSGVSGTGDYTVRLVLPSDERQVSPDPATIGISRGDIHVTDIDFRVASRFWHPSDRGPGTGSPGDPMAGALLWMSDHPATLDGPNLG